MLQRYPEDSVWILCEDAKTKRLDASSTRLRVWCNDGKEFSQKRFRFSHDVRGTDAKPSFLAETRKS